MKTVKCWIIPSEFPETDRLTCREVNGHLFEHEISRPGQKIFRILTKNSDTLQGKASLSVMSTIFKGTLEFYYPY